MNWQSLVRKHIWELKPYTSARDEFSGSAHVFLDANENPFGSLSGAQLHRYPDPHQQAVKQGLSAIKGVAPEQIFLGNGSDEAIDLLYRIFCEPHQDEVILCPPTYGMYEVSADIHAVKAVKVPLLPNFQLDVEGILKAQNEHTKMLFICSPNNPTANAMHAQDIKRLLVGFQGLVIVDEAYIDFSDETSFISELGAHANLVVLQTFSKAWGMAAIRLGMAFTHPEIIGLLNKVKPPYNISELNQQEALKALNNHLKLADWVAQLLQLREKLTQSLISIPGVMQVYPSDANFVLAKVINARGVYDQLVTKGIIVRDRSKVTLCEDCLRITVGTADENQAFLEALSAILANKTPKG
jgi:histidinol-phosphate aminotransferase